MPSFQLSRKIPPSEVSLAFLKQLEEVLLVDVASQIDTSATRPGETIESGYSLHIRDELGIEVLESVRAYRPLLLPDSTTLIRVTFSSPFRATPKVNVDIAFEETGSRSRFTVDVRGDHARDVAVGIADRISQVLSPQKRGSAFWYAPATVYMANGAAIVMMVATIMNPAKPGIGIGGLGLMLASTLYHQAITRLRPYTIFESELSQRRASKWKWFVSGFWTFVIFGTVLVFVRRYFFGF